MVSYSQFDLKLSLNYINIILLSEQVLVQQKSHQVKLGLIKKIQNYTWLRKKFGRKTQSSKSRDRQKKTCLCLMTLKMKLLSELK